MATMKTLNGYGFNATEFNGKAASDYLQKTDTATNSAKLGGKAPEYYIQPRNLLDNSDFRNPVNQRDIAYGANRNNGYTIDRWYYEQSAGAGDGYFGLTEYYVSLLAPSNGYSQIHQNLEKYAKLKGKNVTFAARVSHGGTEKIVCVTFTLGSIDVGLNLFEDGNLKLYSVDSMNILIRATGAEEFQFIWAALYEGTYTADTLPPYVPKGYAAELAECLRYFERIGSTFSERIGNTVYVVSGAKSFVCSLQCSRKRIRHPSVSISDVGNYRLLLKDATNASTYSAVSISSFDDITTQEPFISFRVNMVDAITQNSWIQLQRSDGATAAYIDVSADL